MNLTLSRQTCHPTWTCGSLFLEQRHQCYTCEDVVRDLSDPSAKIPGETAIPAGRYQVIVNWSVRFNRRLPLLLSVPHFTGRRRWTFVRIHPGNTSVDTAGCILPGLGFLPSGVTRSVLAFDALFLLLENVPEGEKIWLEVKNVKEKKPLITVEEKKPLLPVEDQGTLP